METQGKTTTLTITVFTRHSATCLQAGNPQWKRCKCRKSLYIYDSGKVIFKTAKTRSWEEAEKVARRERKLRDPATAEIAQAHAALKENSKTVAEAADQWIASLKIVHAGTAKIYKTTHRKINAWAARAGGCHVAGHHADDVGQVCGLPIPSA